MALLTTQHTNNVAALYLSNLLTWNKLPTLLTLNSSRLTASYRLLENVLQQLSVKFIVPTDGVFVFAQLAKHAQSVEEERDFYDRLERHGVRVSPGSIYKGVDKEFGWARITFSVPAKVLEVALERITAFMTMED